MNKRTLVEAVATSAGLDLGQVDAALTALIAVVGTALSQGDTVVLPGFGMFEVRERAARTGRNPQTGEVLQIAASKAPAFKAAAALKQAVREA